MAKGSQKKIQPNDNSHEAIVAQAAIHFTLTTHLKDDIDLKSAVRHLLGADVAISAAWPSERGIRVTPRMRKFARLLEKADVLKEDVDEYERHPSFAAIAKFACRHPHFLMRSLFRRKSKQDSRSPARADTPGAVDDAVEAGKEVLFDSQKISSVEREIDARLFGGASRDLDEFVRLNLRGSYHDIRLPGTTDTFHVVFEPRLLIHKSGVVQLTIAVPIKAPVTTSQLIQLSRSDHAVVAKSQTPEPLVAHDDDGRWDDEEDAGARLRDRDNDGWSIDDLLHEHMIVVAKSLKARYRSRWSIYATIFGTAGTCCRNYGTWRNNHESDIAQIAARHQLKKPFAHEQLSGRNLALEHDSFLSSNIGSTTKIDYASNVREPIDELNTVLLIEHVLLQYCRLQNIEYRVARPGLYRKKLRRLQYDAVQAFTDMSQHEVRYGSAREIATYLLDDLGAKEMRRTIETALDLASQANATREASIQARRSITLTWIGTVLAALVAIPALSQLLALTVKLDPTASFTWLLASFQWLEGLGGWGPWLIVFGLVGVAVLWQLARMLWWAARLLWLIGRVIISRRGPLVPERLTVAVEIRDDPAATQSQSTKS